MEIKIKSRKRQRKQIFCKAVHTDNKNPFFDTLNGTDLPSKLSFVNPENMNETQSKQTGKRDWHVAFANVIPNETK